MVFDFVFWIRINLIVFHFWERFLFLQIIFLIFLAKFCILNSLSFCILLIPQFFSFWFSLIILRADIVTWLFFVSVLIHLLIIIGGKLLKILMVKVLCYTGICKSCSIISKIKNLLWINHLLLIISAPLSEFLLLLSKLSNLSLHLNHMLLKN